MPYLEYYILGIIVLPGLLLSMFAQFKVNRTYSIYSKVKSNGNQTAAEVARLLLDSAGLKNVKVVRVRGHLTDHYNPKTKQVALSSGIYDSTSIAALGIAAHEVGHAVQYKQNYFPIILRKIAIPVANISSKLLWPLVFIGIALGFGGNTNGIMGTVFVYSGIAVFGLALLVNLITLPVEFDASKRAVKVLAGTQILNKEETYGAKKVLDAAALTYIAAMVVAILNLIRFLLYVRRD